MSARRDTVAGSASKIGFQKSVRVVYGATKLDRTPFFPYCIAMFFVNISTPAFAAAYAGNPIAVIPFTEERFTIAAPGLASALSSNLGIAARQQ